MTPRYPQPDDEPTCPHCESNSKPERLAANVYLCTCCAKIFSWPAER